MKRAILIGLFHLIARLYGGKYEAAKILAEYIRDEHQGENGFMEDCTRCEGLDFCLICPGFRKVLKERKRG